MISVMRGVGQGYSAAIEWLQSPIIAGLFIVGFMALYLHAMLGIQAVVEDYVADVGRQEILVLAVRGVTLAITAISVVAVLVVTMS
jgi:succinate dehydrogenase hydrophobic membrane anchor protein